MARINDGEAIYGVADMFRSRCLVNRTSLLWPNEPAWTKENLSALWDAFIGNPDQGKRSFMEKWRDQLAEQPLDVHRIAADVMVLYYLFPGNIGHHSKLNGVREVIGWRLADEGEPPALSEVDAAFHRGLGHAGIYYLTGRPSQVAFYLAFARGVLESSVDPHDFAACKRLADTVRTQIVGSIAARNILLHLLYPAQFERIASDTHKWRIVNTFREDAGDVTDVDDALLAIRRAQAERLGRDDVDFYQSEIYPKWNKGDDGGSNGNVDHNGGGGIGPTREIPKLEDLAAATHLERGVLKEIEELLFEKRQLIFEGPPGSGKTYVGELFARWFVGLPLAGPVDDRLEIVQFHQSYGYEDFVQGIRPETDTEGRLRYRVRDGIFKRLCGLAASNPDRRFVLIIDEINRGNVARIFGELLLLLEYREQRARLPYAEADAGDDAYLSIPSNLYLIGTMNSTDRSLAQVDYALRRRFYFRRFLPVEDGNAKVLAGWLRAKGISDGDAERLLRLFVQLNRRVEDLLSPDFQVGHSYFMVADIASDRGLDRVWRRAVLPLLEEYFHNHRDREVLLSDLTPDRLLASAPSGEPTVLEP